MRKTYRISVFNKHTGRRELMWEKYTSKKTAKELADKLNELDACKIINAKVVVEIG